MARVNDGCLQHHRAMPRRRLELMTYHCLHAHEHSTEAPLIGADLHTVCKFYIYV